MNSLCDTMHANCEFHNTLLNSTIWLTSRIPNTWKLHHLATRVPIPLAYYNILLHNKYANKRSHADYWSRYETLV